MYINAVVTSSTARRVSAGTATGSTSISTTHAAATSRVRAEYSRRP